MAHLGAWELMKLRSMTDALGDRGDGWYSSLMNRSATPVLGSGTACCEVRRRDCRRELCPFHAVAHAKRSAADVARGRSARLWHEGGGRRWCFEGLLRQTEREERTVGVRRACALPFFGRVQGLRPMLPFGRFITKQKLRFPVRRSRCEPACACLLLARLAALALRCLLQTIIIVVVRAHGRQPTGRNWFPGHT